MAEPKQKWCSVVDVSGCERKIWSCKGKYCIRTWNVKLMNQGKLDMVKKEMTRLNINILGISELKQMGMGEFNKDDNYISYNGQQSFRRNRVTLIFNEKVWNALLGCKLRNNMMISVCFKGNHSTVIQV